VLTDDERGALETLARKRKASQALAERARIVLACAENGGTGPVTADLSQTSMELQGIADSVARPAARCTW
jgi:hypothetical protein